jgi:hypothetical protein
MMHGQRNIKLCVPVLFVLVRQLDEGCTSDRNKLVQRALHDKIFYRCSVGLSRKYKIFFNIESIKIQLQHYGHPTNKKIINAVNKLVLKYSFTFARKRIPKFNTKHMFRNSDITINDPEERRTPCCLST